LLAGPVRLPLLSVDLPLFAFYGFAPPMFVVLHLYVLMQLYLLARLLRLFDDDLRAAVMIGQDRRRVLPAGLTRPKHWEAPAKP
jgi:hypothetical protein